MAEYMARQGDCILSIAESLGFFWETIWNHPDNARLRELRRDPNILLPGDKVIIPEKTPRVETKSTDGRATFVKKTVAVQVKLRLLDWKRKPRANVRYVATVDGIGSSGQADIDGYITLTVKPSCRDLTLKVMEGSKTDEYSLPLGFIDPIDEISGVQQRLTNLGFPYLSDQGMQEEGTTTPIHAFQKEMGLTVTGDVDDATRAKLKELHGS